MLIWEGGGGERKSTLGFDFLLNNGVISWSSKKQSCIALLTMEARFVAFPVTMHKAIWLRRFLKHLTKKGDVVKLVVINCDSQAAIAYTKDLSSMLKPNI